MNNFRPNKVTCLIVLGLIGSFSQIHAQECDIFLSVKGFGEGASSADNVFNGSVGDSGSFYVWIKQNVSIDTGIFLDIKPCTPGGVSFNSGDTFPADITVAGTTVNTRWSQVQSIQQTDQCISLNAIGLPGGTGIDPANSGSGPFIDSLFDPTAGAFLFGRVDFDIISNEPVEICCEPGCGLIVDDCEELDLECCTFFVEPDGKVLEECTFESNNLLCDLDGDGQPTGDFVVTGEFTNMQDIPGTHLFLFPNATPQGVEVCFGNGQQGMQIDPPLNNGDSYEVGSDLSNSNAIIVKNAMPGDEVCFTMTLLGENGVECCTLEACFVMPPCDCLQVDRRFDEISDVVCNADGTVDFSYSFQLTNLFGMDVYHSFLGSLGDELFLPDFFDLLAANGNMPLLQGQSVQLKTVVTGAMPGDLVDFLITIHNEDLSECCTRPHDVLALECEDADGQNNMILLGDMNVDGVVDLIDVQPFVELLSSGVFMANGDVNEDGAFDLNDVAPFVGLLTGSPK